MINNSVLPVYYYTYKFTVERLFDFINDPSMMLLVTYYIQNTQLKRFHQKVNIRRNRSSYYEGLSIMYRQSD